MEYARFTPKGRSAFMNGNQRGWFPLGAEIRADEFVNFGFILKNQARFVVEKNGGIDMVRILINPITIHSLFEDYQFSFTLNHSMSDKWYPFQLMTPAEIAKARMFKPFYKEKEDEH